MTSHWLTVANSRSWLARLDPRLKLLWIGAVSLAAVLVDSAPALCILTASVVVVALGLHWRPRTWAVILAILLAVVWGTVVSQAVFYAMEPRTPLVTLVRPRDLGAWHFPGLIVYREGIYYGLWQSLRIVATTLAGLTVCLSTAPERMLAAITALRAPAAIGFLTVTALRFLPTTIDEWATVRAAARLRGYRPRLWQPGLRAWRSWRLEAALLVPALAATLRRASTLAEALTARGFDAAGSRTEYPVLRMTFMERLLTAGLVAAAVALSAVKSLYWLHQGGWWHAERYEPLLKFAELWL